MCWQSFTLISFSVSILECLELHLVEQELQVIREPLASPTLKSSLCQRKGLCWVKEALWKKEKRKERSVDLYFLTQLHRQESGPPKKRKNIVNQSKFAQDKALMRMKVKIKRKNNFFGWWSFIRVFGLFVILEDKRKASHDWSEL